MCVLGIRRLRIVVDSRMPRRSVEVVVRVLSRSTAMPTRAGGRAVTAIPKVDILAKQCSVSYARGMRPAAVANISF